MSSGIAQKDQVSSMGVRNQEGAANSCVAPLASAGTVPANAHAGGPPPVFVYIHGGAFNSGSGEVLLYDGESLAQQGVTVVTIKLPAGGGARCQRGSFAQLDRSS
jgi:carboxylesterase type B